MIDVEPFQPCEIVPDFSGEYSIMLGQLYEEGYFDWDDGTWEFPKYDDVQDARLKQKIIDHYYLRELAILPLGAWKHEFLRKMREVVPKYIPLYEALDKTPQLLGATSDYYKSRNIYTDFPQSGLNGQNGDYASTGNDMEYERIRQLDILDIGEKLESFEDVDMRIVTKISSLFADIMVQSINAF